MPVNSDKLQSAEVTHMRKAVRISPGHENYLIYKFLIQFLSFGIGFILFLTVGVIEYAKFNEKIFLVYA